MRRAEPPARLDSRHAQARLGEHESRDASCRAEPDDRDIYRITPVRRGAQRSS